MEDLELLDQLTGGAAFTASVEDGVIPMLLDMFDAGLKPGCHFRHIGERRVLGIRMEHLEIGRDAQLVGASQYEI